jgi:hypothetical protein
MVFPAMLHVQSGIYYFLTFLPILGYDLFFENVYHGQSPGKMILGIKVVKMNGSSPSFLSYLLRWIFRIFDNLLLSGAIATVVILINGKGQRLGDLAAGTVVIKIKHRYSLGNTVFTQLPQDYVPKFETAKLLSDEDVRVIKEVMVFLREHPKSENYVTISENIRTRLEKKMGVRSELHILEFLQTVLCDYNFLNR